MTDEELLKKHLNIVRALFANPIGTQNPKEFREITCKKLSLMCVLVKNHELTKDGIVSYYENDDNTITFYLTDHAKELFAIIII